MFTDYSKGNLTTFSGKFIPEPSVAINRVPPPCNLNVPYNLQVSRINSPISSTYHPDDIKLLLSITIK